MTAPVPFNPIATTNAGGTFTIQSEGDIQGMTQDDPAVRFSLKGGYLAATEMLPMWGGVLIYEDIPNPSFNAGPNAALGSAVGRATSLVGGSFVASAISTFNQAHAMISSPQSPVPLAGSGMSVHYHRFGSGARIAVAIDPSLVSLEGGLVGQQVSWDFNLQRLVPYVAAYPANALTALSWGTVNGGQATGSTTSPHGLAPGADFTISGVTPTGYNGAFTALAGTTGSTLVWSLPVNPGAETVLGTLVAGGGALPCRINRISTGNSMIVVYNALTGAASWNYSGATAVIQI